MIWGFPKSWQYDMGILHTTDNTGTITNLATTALPTILEQHSSLSCPYLLVSIILSIFEVEFVPTS